MQKTTCERVRKNRLVNAREARTAPSHAVLSAFGLRGSLQPLSGGQGTAWLVEAVVLKPLDMAPVMLAWQHSLLARLAGRSDFRVSVPLRTTDGAFTADGWTAWRYQSGSHRDRRWHEIIAVGRRCTMPLFPNPNHRSFAGGQILGRSGLLPPSRTSHRWTWPAGGGRCAGRVALGC